MDESLEAEPECYRLQGANCRNMGRSLTQEKGRWKDVIKKSLRPAGNWTR